MSPEQHDRARLLRTRNGRRLQRHNFEKAFKAIGLNALPVPDDREERLLASFKQASPVDELELHEDWQSAVSDFSDGRFGLSVGMLWDWDGSSPLCRIAAASLRAHSDRLGTLYPGGFWLVDDNDCDAFVVDFDLDEDAGLAVARVRKIELAYAQD